jgi:hypothetical protein
MFERFQEQDDSIPISYKLPPFLVYASLRSRNLGVHKYDKDENQSHDQRAVEMMHV